MTSRKHLEFMGEAICPQLPSKLDRRCGGGGGGGGDGGAAEREAQRQQRIAAGTAAVNRIFGVGDGTTTTPTVSTSNLWKPTESERTTFDQGHADEATTNRSARDALYGTVRNDTRDYYARQLEEDRAQALRELNFAKARAGTFGSSQGIDLDTEFRRRLDRGLLDVGNRADSAASGLRSNDEQARLGLISKIVAGMDQGSATSSAMQQLASNAEQARNQAMSGRMANVFADLFGAYNQQQTRAGEDAAKQQYQNGLGNFFPNNSGASGTITKG